MRPRVLVVGAGGFLARHLLPCLKRDFAGELVTVGRGEPAERVGRHHSFDCGNLGKVREVIRSETPDRIVCLAGSSGPDFGEMLRYNVEVAGAILAEAAKLKKQHPVRVVLAGSAAEFGPPTHLPVTESAALAPSNEYGLTKSLQTRLAEFYRRNRADSLRVCVAHLFNLIGPGSPNRLVFGSFVEQIANSVPGGVLRVGNLDSERDFIHVRDAAEAIVAILSLADPAPSYVVASGRPLRIRDLLDHLIRLSGRDLAIEVDPARKMSSDVQRIFGDSALLSRTTGWVTRRTPEDAVLEMWEESA